ncbi:hypothetical protein L6R50_14805 [Myxococcota bacterium]|nr:hypothetical protein [Myxococcota bacterium]
MARGLAARTVPLPAGSTTDPQVAGTPWTPVVSWTATDEGQPCTVWLRSTVGTWFRVRWTFADATNQYVYVSVSGGGGERIQLNAANVIVDAVAMDGASAGQAFAGIGHGTFPRANFQAPVFDLVLPVNTAGVPPTGKCALQRVPPWVSWVSVDGTGVSGLVSATLNLYDARGLRSVASSDPQSLAGVDEVDVQIETTVAGAYGLRLVWGLTL